MSTLRELRKALGLSQEAIAKQVGKSFGSIRSYEDGRKLPPDVMGKMLSLAVRAGLPDIANQIEDEAAKLYGGTVHAMAIDEARPEESREERNRLHALLDYVLDAGRDATAQALRETIQVFYTATRCLQDPLGDTGHDEFVAGPTAEYRLTLPLDFGDGVRHAAGDVVELDLATALQYKEGLIAIGNTEQASEKKLA